MTQIPNSPGGLRNDIDAIDEGSSEIEALVQHP